MQYPEHGDDDWVTGYSEGYAFFADGGTMRLIENGGIESMTDIVYGDPSVQEESDNNSGIIADIVGHSFVMHVPVSALNKEFYLARNLLIESGTYGVYSLYNIDNAASYCFDFSSLFNRKGLSFTGAKAEWGFKSYFEDGCTYSN